MKILLKLTLALVAIGVLGFLFVRSARSTGAEPFAIPRAHLSGWTLALSPAEDQFGALLTLTPRPELLPPLSRQLFSRMGETLHYPGPAMPLVLRSEFDAMQGAITPAAILELAKAAGLETASIQPRCMARRRDSAVGVLRGAYFLVFDLPQFAQFREQLAQRIQATSSSALFDPSAMSPVVIAAALDSEFSRWLPLRAAEADCFAPITVE
ncbi:MAG TPA: hypothetical protein VNT81_13465 [Vicinamibacterales bacterium]|nr:hypothetical protein [Vicinamibacterales bacterium]